MEHVTKALCNEECFKNLVQNIVSEVDTLKTDWEATMIKWPLVLYFCFVVFLSIYLWPQFMIRLCKSTCLVSCGASVDLLLNF